MKNEKYDFRIRFTGELEEVDINTFIDALGNLMVGIHQINDDLYPGKGLKVNIKEIKPDGSVGIFLTIKKSLIGSLPILKNITGNDIFYASAVVGILVGILELRKHLKGEKPEKIEEEKDVTIITNINSEKIQIDNRTYNVFKENHVLDAAIGKAFDTLESDDSVEGLEVYGEDKKKIFEANRKDFKFLSKPAVTPEKDTRIKTEDVILAVFKVVFEIGYKWQFYYHGIKISADVKDESFFQMINGGAKFSKGDTLIVELQITQVYDKSVETYINKEYVISKVKQHIPRAGQTSLLESKNKNNT